MCIKKRDCKIVAIHCCFFGPNFVRNIIFKRDNLRHKFTSNSRLQWAGPSIKAQIWVSPPAVAASQTVLTQGWSCALESCPPTSSTFWMLLWFWAVTMLPTSNKRKGQEYLFWCSVHMFLCILSFYVDTGRELKETHKSFSTKWEIRENKSREYIKRT